MLSVYEYISIIEFRLHESFLHHPAELSLPMFPHAQNQRTLTVLCCQGKHLGKDVHKDRQKSAEVAKKFREFLTAIERALTCRRAEEACPALLTCSSEP